MLNLSASPFDDYVRDNIQASVNKLWRYSRLEVTGGVKSDANGTMFLKVHVTQTEPVDDKTLTETELITRIRTVMETLLPKDYPMQITATPLNP
ncbi:hypothetical protein DYBT9275_03043 [Dyadobacter sp. CECT 9275]|uniref:Uncharacterized protein n=1 Tax=Dyadobacter helix TaxID=2822344 RepID=A0A916JCU2_9BACT|nr:hypothetical protein [Dyadobacter sp. CECT 9275]CAG5003072.1 hypothetical protein DYBT9275_03043 [Dyadobacter sp. CECT 9275]